MPEEAESSGKVWPRRDRPHFHFQFKGQNYGHGFPTTRSQEVQCFSCAQNGAEILANNDNDSPHTNLIKYHYEKVFSLHFQFENQIILLLYSNLGLCNNNSSYCFLTPYMFLELPSKLLGPSGARCRFDEV